MKHRYAITVATAGLAATAAAASPGLTSTANAATTGTSAATRMAASAGTAAAPRSIDRVPRAIVAVRRGITAVIAKAPSHVLLDCAFKPQVKPSSYFIACADAGTGIEAMHWTSWTPKLASGYGTFFENNCTPNCASGKIIGYPVVATLWGSAAVKGYPADRRYTELTLVFTGKRPPVDNGPGAKPSHPLTQTFATNDNHA